MPVSNALVANTTGVPYNQWNLAQGASKTAACLTSDGDTTYINAGTTVYRQCFNLAWPTDPPIGRVNSIKAVGVVKYVTTQHTVSLGVRNASGETVETVSTTTGYGTRTTANLARPGGGSWTKDDCANGVTYVQIRGVIVNTTGHARCTYLRLTVDYDPSGESFLTMWSVLVALPGLVGSGLRLEDVAALARVVWRGVTLTPEDCRRALELRREPAAWSFSRGLWTRGGRRGGTTAAFPVG